MNSIDLLIVFLILLGIYAEVTRGLFFALFDLLRIALGLGMGLLGYSVVHNLTHSYAAGLVAFVVVAVFVVSLLATLMRRSRIDPRWGRSLVGRIGAAMVGFALGSAICLVMVPVLGQAPQFEPDIVSAASAQPFIELLPCIHYAADLTNLDLPQFNRRVIHFEDEGKRGAATLGDRINYLRLDGSTCIKCGAKVKFLGYRVKQGLSVSPLFRCPVCGRTSDGCQAFEGFHRMYGRCPYQVIHDSLGIDCGVWPNHRLVIPHGVCPICGRSQPGP